MRDPTPWDIAKVKNYSCYTITWLNPNWATDKTKMPGCFPSDFNTSNSDCQPVCDMIRSQRGLYGWDLTTSSECIIT